MFSLIITIITIALVASLAIASIYYGGDAFNSGSTEASASTVVNQAQQIAAASDMYRAQNSGSRPADMSELTPTYLQDIPTLPDSYFEGGSSVAWDVSSTTDSEGYLTLTDIRKTICDGEDNSINASGGNMYSCVENGSATNGEGTFTYNKQIFQAPSP